jgi:hypothetical protein
LSEVDCSRGGTPIFAHDRDKLVRECVGDAWQFLFDQPGDVLLVIAIGDRPQQAHRHRLELAFCERANDLARLVAVERAHDISLRIDAFVDFEGVAARDVGGRIVVAIIVRIVFAAILEHQNVAEAARGQERGLGGRFGDDRIGRTRRAVDQHVAFAEQRLAVELDLLRGDFDGRAHAIENALGRCQCFADGAYPAPIRDHNIGEGTAGIDRNTQRHVGVGLPCMPAMLERSSRRMTFDPKSAPSCQSVGVIYKVD